MRSRIHLRRALLHLVSRRPFPRPPRPAVLRPRAATIAVLVHFVLVCLVLVCLVLVCLVLDGTRPVLAAGGCGGDRLALVIGNRTYPDGEAPLKGPVEGAKRIADALKAIGFDVQYGEDLTKAKMDAAAHDLASRVKPGAAVFVYFSGFGVQAGGHTYLLPTDASIWSEADIAINGLNIDRLLAEIEDKKAAVEVVVIDGARRNPFERRFRATGSAGLAAPRALGGNLVALYSARPDKVYDPSELAATNFADDVAREITAPHATAQEAFKQVRAMVARTSRAGQMPWGFSTLADDLPLDVRDCSASTAGAGSREPGRTAEAAPEPRKEAEGSAAPEPRKTAEGSTPPPAPTPASPPVPAAPAPGNAAALTDGALLSEVHDRLYEQNLDPGPVGSETMTEAVHAFERRAGLPETDRPTQGLLDALRAAPSLAPWGAIVVADDIKSWGMSWDKATRREAVSDAKARCGGASCNRQMAFAGKSCGAFALSANHWIVAHRDGGDAARKAALSDCGRSGSACRVIGSVCADGSDKTE